MSWVVPTVVPGTRTFPYELGGAGILLRLGAAIQGRDMLLTSLKRPRGSRGSSFGAASWQRHNIVGLLSRGRRAPKQDLGKAQIANVRTN